MQTHFAPRQLADPATAASESNIRKCVHCGFCTATCPTYVLLGDELDSPRGRIYLIKDMLENERAPDAELVKHVDRCLSCLSCMTTCPSGVNYAQLIDHARAYIEQRYRRPWHDRLFRALLASVLPRPALFRTALRLLPAVRPLVRLLSRVPRLAPLSAMLVLAPSQLPRAASVRKRHAQHARGRVLMLKGCAEAVLKPQYRDAASRVLNRLGYDVAFAEEERCCGALVQHMGRERDALAAARRNVDAWHKEIAAGGVAAIIVTASGCGTMVKDYGHLLRDDPAYAGKAAACAALARDINEFLAEQDFSALVTEPAARGLAVAYHPACSLQHGQKLGDVPAKLLRNAGFDVRIPAESHLCCGSAGSYNILQPEIAGQLAARKAANIGRLGAPVVATGNVGCAVQIGKASGLPVVHVVELLDWASGGPAPAGFPGITTMKGQS
jgi:glycolate oxidase iron-sulfur subunit